MAQSDTLDYPVTKRPHRRLQWATVVIGFLFFVLLLAEAAIIALGMEGSAVKMAAPVPGGDTAQILLLSAAGGALVLGGLTMLLAGACIGRYRFLAKVAALLLFLGAMVRVAWPFLLETASRLGVFESGQLLGTQVVGGSDAPITDAMLANLHWFAAGPALALTLIGLLGLVLFAPKRVAVETREDRPAAARADDPYSTPAQSGPAEPAPVASTGTDARDARTDQPGSHSPQSH